MKQQDDAVRWSLAYFVTTLGKDEKALLERASDAASARGQWYMIELFLENGVDSSFVLTSSVQHAWDEEILKHGQ